MVFGGFLQVFQIFLVQGVKFEIAEWQKVESFLTELFKGRILIGRKRKRPRLIKIKDRICEKHYFLNILSINILLAKWDFFEDFLHHCTNPTLIYGPARLEQNFRRLTIFHSVLRIFVVLGFRPFRNSSFWNLAFPIPRRILQTINTEPSGAFRILYHTKTMDFKSKHNCFKFSWFPSSMCRFFQLFIKYSWKANCVPPSFS